MPRHDVTDLVEVSDDSYDDTSDEAEKQRAIARRPLDYESLSSDSDSKGSSKQ